MTTKAALAAVLLMALMVYGCDNASPTAPAEPQMSQQGVALVSAQQAGATRVPVSGMIYATGGTGGDVRLTPGGIFHQEGGTTVTEWTGDVTGTVTFLYKRQHFPADGSHLVAKGPGEGEVTWNGRTGAIAGVFTTECKPDTALPYSCDGNLVVHGSGELEGVKFHVYWGPGWWPFPYEGTALDPHGA